MADDSLDDFFAKKDKSKKGKKSTFKPGDLITSAGLKKLDSEKKITKRITAKEKQQKTVPSDAPAEAVTASGIEKVLLQTDNDEEWQDFDNPEEKDYSGLRIQKLQISGQEEDDGDEDAVDEDGNAIVRKGGERDPWNVSTPAAGAAAEADPDEEEEEEEEEIPTEEKAPTEEDDKDEKKAYIPPALRNKLAQQSKPSAVPYHRRNPKTAPDIKSEELFPSLGSVKQDSKAAKKLTPMSSGDFQRVKSGARQSDAPSSRGPNLDTENRYDALRKGTR